VYKQKSPSPRGMMGTGTKKLPQGCRGEKFFAPRTGWGNELKNSPRGDNVEI